MINKLRLRVVIGLFVLAAGFGSQARAASNNFIERVLLISIDGMHALDFANCVGGGLEGAPYCPSLANLLKKGTTYVNASTSKPSDSFPGLTAQITGGSPRSSGIFYDVSYDRALSPPAQTTPYGIVGGPTLCPSVVGTQVGFDEEIDNDLTKLDGGGGINPNYLPRDPNKNCAPVYPHTYLRDNTIFEVVKASGGYTAWSDKHPSYEFTNGPSGHGVDDFYGPEINSIPVPLPTVPGCDPLPDQAATTSSDDWTTSFQNIRCYDSLKVQATINQINGKTHDGIGPVPVPTLFGMNFQAVSVGEKLVEYHPNPSSPIVGGYSDALGTPSGELLSEIEFVDASIGKILAALSKRKLLDSTLIIISAKHGQSPIDPNRVLRIPADNPSDQSPATILGSIVAQSDEDDVSLIWLSDQTQTASAAATLATASNEAIDGGGEIFAGPSVDLIFNNPLADSRTPDIVVAPNVGVIYTGGMDKIAEHGGFAHDDTNVLLLVTNPKFAPSTVTEPVQTAQIAPTILTALGLDPHKLKAVKQEHTQPLPGLPF